MFQTSFLSFTACGLQTFTAVIIFALGKDVCNFLCLTVTFNALWKNSNRNKAVIFCLEVRHTVMVIWSQWSYIITVRLAEQAMKLAKIFHIFLHKTSVVCVYL